MKRLTDLGTWRQWVLRALGWCHCGLLYLLYYGLLLWIFQGGGALPLGLWRGLLALLPLALADVGALLCRKLWQFSLLSLALCGLTWLLLSHPAAIAPLALVCLLRGKNSLSEDPVDSALDRPLLPAAALFLAPFLYSAVMGEPWLQKASLVWAAVYLLLWAGWHGFRTIDQYLSLNRDRAGVPAKRIVRTSGLALLGMLVLAGALLLPALVTEEGVFRIDPQTREVTVQAQAQTPEMPAAMERPEWLDQLGQGSSFQFPPFLNYLLWALTGGLAGAALLYGAYCLLRTFRSSFVDHRDVVQYLRGPQEKPEEAPRRKRQRPRLWDRSPNAQVRRKYRRAVLQASKEPPPVWAAPREIEEGAGLRDAQLHQLYEKARYSREGCTLQESRSLKRQ